MILFFVYAAKAAEIAFVRFRAARTFIFVELWSKDRRL